MNRAARLFPLGLTLGMALLALYLHIVTTQQPFARPDLNLNEPEYTISNLQARQYDEHGMLQERLYAKSLWQLPRNPLVFVQEPLLTRYQNGKADFSVNASTATYHRQEKLAELKDNVRWAQEQPGKTPIVLQTSSMQLDGNKHEVRNQAPLLLTQQNSRLNATGFIYRQDSQTLELLSNVRIFYAP